MPMGEVLYLGMAIVAAVGFAAIVAWVDGEYRRARDAQAASRRGTAGNSNDRSAAHAA